MGQIQVLHRETFASPPSHDDRTIMWLNGSVIDYTVAVEDASVYHGISLDIAVERSFWVSDVVAVEVQRLVRVVNVDGEPRCNFRMFQLQLGVKYTFDDFDVAHKS